MNILIKIFLMFAKLSAFAFGGGYVMFPMLMKEIESNKLISMNDLADIIAIASMSPGAVSVNAAVGVGYKVAGIPGVVAAFLGIAVPCAVIVIIVATFFFKVYNHPIVRSALYGLRPIITGIILYAAFNIARTNGIIAASENNLIDSNFNVMINGVHLFELKSLIITIASFFALVKTKLHPIFVILISALIGIMVF